MFGCESTCQSLRWLSQNCPKMMLQKIASLLERHVCQANGNGSSLAMKIQRETTRPLQYTEYFGDGDGKAYSEIEHFYCTAMFMWEKKCVGHVQKRVGTTFRNLKKGEQRNWWERKTDALIDKLQNYYGIAVSNCGKVEGMKAANLCQHFLLCLNNGRLDWQTAKLLWYCR